MTSQLDHIETGDGSSTLFSKKFQEHYHSLHGAISESRHVFIEMGLVPCLQLHKNAAILEVGLGTGLNALLSILHPTELPIHYLSVESLPLNIKQVEQLNYAHQLARSDSKDLLLKIHETAWGVEVNITPRFVLQKMQVELQDFHPKKTFNLVYFDAFAPNTQPELWTKEIFSKIYTFCEPDAALVTYSSKGSVRRTLQGVGFEVEKLPGPPGKREMLRAWKK